MLLTGPLGVRADPYHWDANLDADGTGGTGAWDVGDASATAWRQGSETGALTRWPNTNPNADEAVFGGTAGTVTLNSESADVNVNRITFATAGYIIAAPAAGTARLNLSGTAPVIGGAATINANLAGTAGFTKSSSGDLRLGGDNSGLTGTVNISGANVGTDRVFLNSAAPVSTDGFTLSGGANATWNLSGSATLLFNNTTPGAKSVRLGALSGSDATPVLRNAGSTAVTTTFVIGGLNTDTTYAGQIQNGTGTAAITKAGTGALSLTNAASNYSGTTTLSDGTLAVGADGNAAVTAGPLGRGTIDFKGTFTAVFRSADANTRTLYNALVLSNNTVFGSAGTGDLVFNGAMNTGGLSKIITVNNSSTTFAGVLSGTTNANPAPPAVPSVMTKAGPGTLVLSNAANTTNKFWVVAAGTLKLAPPSGTNNLPGALGLTVDAGATLDVSAVPGGFALTAGQLLRGNGTIAGPLTVASGSRVSPGASTGLLTTGPQTWAGGGTYVWEVNDAAGTAGSTTAGYDRINIGGPLTVSADGSAPFNIRVTSLDAAQQPGPAANFDPAVSRNWVIAAAGGIAGAVGPGNFLLDTSGFRNDFTGGRFDIAAVGNDVVLSYVAPIPEPTAVGLLATAAAAGLLRRGRRRA